MCERRVRSVSGASAQRPDRISIDRFMLHETGRAPDLVLNSAAKKRKQKMLRDANKNIFPYMGAIVAPSGSHLYNEPTNAQVSGAKVESLASFDQGSPLAMAPGLESPRGNSIERALRKVALLDCERRTDLVSTCTAEIWMKLDVSMPVPRSSPPNMSRVTLDHVYRDGAWHVADEERDWAGGLIVDKLMRGELYAD